MLSFLQSPQSFAKQIERHLRWTGASELDLRRGSTALRATAHDRELTTSELVDAFALVREAARRCQGTPHYRVQLQAGWALQAGAAVEMETGEGKTLTALLVAFTWALAGQGCHVLTANDYLAERDARLAQDILGLLGISVGWITQSSTPEERHAAYQADITYVTVTQIGFDFLRDRVARRSKTGEQTLYPIVQRPLAAAVIDEADLVMLDEARTPLLLAVAEPIPETQSAECAWAQATAARLERDRDFLLLQHARVAQLTEAGCRKVLLAPMTSSLPALWGERCYQLVERALEARWLYRADHDYLVREGKVGIIGAATGRVLEGRQWQNGLQPAIEWKERTEFSPRTRSNGSITIQSLLKLYPRRCGMSGTLKNARRELQQVYGMRVQTIPPRLPCLRRPWPARCFADRAAKLAAIAAEVRRLQQLGRPVLVGTASMEASEQLSALLQQSGLDHELLTAREPAREAEIVALAGQAGHITIATNMAGRGTDIRVSPDVRASGGLHVILAGLQASTRTDRQLMGRTARQGDPGSYQEFLACDDELLCEWNPDLAQRWQRRVKSRGPGELSPLWQRRFRAVQRQVEQLHARQRLLQFQQQQATERWCESVGIDPFLEWLPADKAA